MSLHAQFAVGGLDFFVGSVLGDAQCVVVVFHIVEAATEP